MIYRCRRPVLVAFVYLATANLVIAAQEPTPDREPNLTEEQKEDFLRRAKVVASHPIGKGITHPWRLTLSDGTLTYDATFQAVDEHENLMRFENGRTELNFVDSYRYNIAAYELSKLLGMDTQLPVTVKRDWSGQAGARSWRIPWKWDEEMRIKADIHPPDLAAWNQQTYRIRFFNELIYDTDPNLTNFLITEDWKVWRIDFSRAFRL